MAKDTFYFSHDYNARSDIKIKKLIAKEGMQGYGIYWSIVEELYNNANALPTDYETIAFDLRCDCELVKIIVENYGLFEIKQGSFSSDSIDRRLKERAEKSNKARESAKARWGKNANAMRTHSDSNAIKERKGKENKENNIDSNEFYFERFKNDFSNCENIAMNLGIHPKYLDKAKQDFMTLVKFGEPKPNYREFLNHFTNWAKKTVTNYKMPPR